LLAVVVITPFVKDTSISLGALAFSVILLIIGSFLAYKGGKNNE
jgi:hypothetical protein